MKKAHKTDWNTLHMPQKQVLLSIQKEFTQAEYEKLQYGLIPEQMEDKWFIYFKSDKLYFHRSWTGICIYVISLEQSQGRIYISKAWVNADPEQYGVADNKEERDALDYLINRLLLRKSISPPEKYNPIESWSMFGREILDKDGQE